MTQAGKAPRKQNAAAAMLGTATLALVIAAAPAHAAADGTEHRVGNLEYRNIGPWRGGRATTIAGHPDTPQTFFTGTVGGVFKSTNSGMSWTAVGDEDFNTVPVGAVAVAPSNPQVVLVGMGESPFRGVASSQGDGIYRSVNGGRSFSHLGLRNTRQIAEIVIHPDDPDVIIVAAQGDSWVPSDDRGVYKTTDGGATWRKVLAGDNPTTGAIDLKIDPGNPRILYAALWDHERDPHAIRSGGPGSGLYRSEDLGETWTKLTEGLPELIGKSGIAPSGARDGRVWAVIEAADGKGGVYRSDDAGETWSHVNDTRKTHARSWYYMDIFADPQDADTVYVMNAPFMKSVDGGKTFEEISNPHTDQHDLWINPEDPKVLANANDGGATISLDGGESWSGQHNQPTAQFYRLAVDNQVPYRLYAGQQDNSTVSIPSRAPDGRIGRDDYYAIGGGESAHVAFDPDNPRYIYAGSYLGYLTEYDTETQTTRYVTGYPELAFGVPPKDRQHRWNWNAPVVVSRHDPSVIFHGAERVFRSSDRGTSWEAISGDLTRDTEATQGPGGGPITNEVSENYHTILTISESPTRDGVIWVGTDDGRLHVTETGGGAWTDVTPEGIDDGMINAIDISPHEDGTVLVAYTRYKEGDQAPYIYSSSDNGRSWTRLDGGLPENAFVRVVREDPVREGLLVAGTELGVFLSTDNGRSWQELTLNMPHVPVTDLRFVQGDLALSTQGRGFWILDDISAFRQMSADIAGSEAHLFAPRKAHRFERGGGNGGEGPNPPSGAIIHYHLGKAPDIEATTIKLDIRDASGNVIRTLTSDPEAGEDGASQGFTTHLPAKAGLNRVVWDMRIDPVASVPGVWMPSADDGGTIGGHHVAPGTYTIAMSIGDRPVGEASLDLAWDPRLTFDDDKITEQQALLDTLHEMIDELHRSIASLRKIRQQAEERLAFEKENPNAPSLGDEAEAVIDAVDEWEASVISTEREFFQDVLNWPDRLSSDLQHIYGVVDGAVQGVTAGMKQRKADLEEPFEAALKRRDRIVSGPVAAYNAAFEKAVGAPLQPAAFSAGD